MYDIVKESDILQIREADTHFGFERSKDYRKRDGVSRAR